MGWCKLQTFSMNYWKTLWPRDVIFFNGLYQLLISCATTVHWCWDVDGRKKKSEIKKTNVLASPFLDFECKGDLESGNFHFWVMFLHQIVISTLWNSINSVQKALDLTNPAKNRRKMRIIDLNFQMNKLIGLACRVVWNWPSKSTTQSLIFREM